MMIVCLGGRCYVGDNNGATRITTTKCQHRLEMKWYGVMIFAAIAVVVFLD